MPAAERANDDGKLNELLETNRPGNIKVEFARLYAAWGKFQQVFLASAMCSTELWYRYTGAGSLLDEKIGQAKAA